MALNHRAREVAPRFAVADMGGGEYELVLYGEVMEDDPRDWWTGERTGEQAATSELVNREMAALKNASHVTVRLNSCGGDLYAGLAIYSALRALDADVTVRIEGIAASAASVIACAGSEVVAGPGSIFMIHEGSIGLMGYYSRPEIEALLADMDAGVRAMAGVYMGKTGKPEDEIRRMMAEETWLVGEEIVDAGFADTYDAAAPGTDPEEDGGSAVIAGVRHDLAAFRHVPDLAARIAKVKEGIPAHGADPYSSVPQHAAEEEGELIMDLSELREQHPDLVAEIEAAATQRERDRISAIDEVASGIPADMVADAKYGSPITAEQLAYRAMKAQAAEREAAAASDREAAAKFLAATEEDDATGGTEDVGADPNGAEDDEEAEAKASVQAAAAFRAKMKGAL